MAIELPNSRVPDWQTRLDRVVANAAGKDFSWGSHDCALFVADVIDAVVGVDPAGEWRGNYDSEYGALKLCAKRHGGGFEVALRDIAGGLKLRRLHPMFAQRGDVGIGRGRNGLICAVACIGSRWVGTGPDGLIDITSREVVAAWQVGRTNGRPPTKNGIILPESEIDPMCAMPFLAPVVGIVVTAVAAAGLVELGFTSVMLISIISGLAGLLASTAISFMFPPGTAKQADNSSLRVSWDSVSSHKLAYGRVRSSGTCVLKKAYNAVGSDRNDYLMMVMPIAAHLTKEVDQFWINDTIVTPTGDDGKVTTGEFANTAWMKFYNGTTTQNADPMLLEDLPDMVDQNFYMRGISYLRCRFLYKRDVYTQTPNPSVVIFGKSDIYDPRTETYGYTNNPALCIADYLMERRGMRVKHDQIDWDSVAAAANACDELVDRPGGTEARWRCNGIVDTARRPMDVMKEMLSSMAGRAAWRRGQWSLWAGVTTLDAGLATIHADDFVNIDGDEERERLIVLNQRSRRTSANIARAIYNDESKYWHSTDTPPIKYSSRIDVEGELPIDHRHTFTTSRWASQRALHIAMRMLAAKPVPSVTGNLSLHDGLKYAVGDAVKLVLPTFNVDETYIITDWTFDESRTIKVTLQRDGSDIYEAPALVV